MQGRELRRQWAGEARLNCSGCGHLSAREEVVSDSKSEKGGDPGGRKLSKVLIHESNWWYPTALLLEPRCTWDLQ